MTFNSEQVAILEKHRHHWESLQKLGFTKNLDKTIFEDLQGIYNDVIGKQHFSPWCSACVAELIRMLYTVFENVNRPTVPVVNPKSRKVKHLTKVSTFE